MKQRRKVKALFITTLIFVLIIGGSLGYVTVGAAMEGRSALSKLYEGVIEFFMSGDTDVSEEATIKKVEKRRRKNLTYSVPNIYKGMYGFVTEKYEGFEVCYFGDGTEEQTIVYFHGGSYMWQPLIFHYDYCMYLAKTLDVQIIMPIYPKAPDYTYPDVMAWLYGLYTTELSDLQIIAFMGDSAGGGMLINFAQYLTDRQNKAPENLISFSPCLDLSLSNKGMADFAAEDPMLNIVDLRIKLRYYIGDGTYDDPYASAKFCDYSQLGKVTIFMGDRELLLPDAREWDEKLTEQGIEHNYYEFQNQFHVFPIFPMPERTFCMEIIKDVLYG